MFIKMGVTKTELPTLSIIDWVIENVEIFILKENTNLRILEQPIKITIDIKDINIEKN